MATAWLAGGSGLVGAALLRRLLQNGDFDRVVSIGRRTLPVQDPKLIQAETDFATPSAFDSLGASSVAFCCLGTTIAKAGSREAFRKVDHDAVLAFAQGSKRTGAHTFIHLSSLGANVTSATFYSAVKGETERDVGLLGFPSVYALRPSILDGARAERRPAEYAGLLVGRVLAPILGKYRPTLVGTVVETMLALARAPAPGVHVVEPDGMCSA
jgi:uncharacterized protein YbjT (DUF2867 family)